VTLLLDKLPLFIAALWWGSLSALMFLFVPLLFAHLPSPALAGGMAAKLFTAQTWLSLVCGLLLLLLSRGRSAMAHHIARELLVWIAGAMLLALLAEFAVAPRIVARENLALWHSVGSAMYLLQWLCAGVGLWKLAAFSPDAS
jgi:hypothetical protein